MLAKAVLSLGLWLQLAAGQDAPESGECLKRQGVPFLLFPPFNISWSLKPLVKRLSE